MTRVATTILPALILFAACTLPAQRPHTTHGNLGPAYLGFDRNDYPGDAALPALRRTFRYTSFWLNPPPGETANTWAGKRALLARSGFGFLILFNGRLDKDLKAAQLKNQSPAALGAADGQAAAQSAVREGFPPHILIFLDQEEGGSLLPEQSAYLFAWIAAVRSAGDRPGVYCSGIALPNSVSTADDIAAHVNDQKSSANDKSAERAQIALWVANDQCPPSPGCSLTPPALAGAFTPATASLVRVWQYAQSPRRPQFSAGCPANPSQGNNCYAPNTKIFLDLNTSSSPDPSETP